jgi:hypothetical protein
MQEYVEIENVQKLFAYSKSLAKQLHSVMRHTERRTIGYPQGSFTSNVHFISNRGDDVFWWTGGRSDNREAWNNFFGRGKLGGNAALNIDVQINVPIGTFSRHMGGAFLHHRPTDSIIVAHRGIVTLGHGRVRRQELFTEMFSTLREASSDAGPHEFLLIGTMDSPSLVDDIETFATELRRTVKALSKDGSPTESGPATRLSTRKDNFAALGDYFDEFSGRRDIKARKNTVADCYHGTIVRALRDFFADHHDIRKTVAIDLVVSANDRVLLFEVKTASDPQSIYTATGQLAVHASGLAKRLKGKPIIKVMVLPELPAHHLHDVLKSGLDVCVLTFTRSDRGVIEIDGLKHL